MRKLYRTQKNFREKQPGNTPVRTQSHKIPPYKCILTTFVIVFLIQMIIAAQNLLYTSDFRFTESHDMGSHNMGSHVMGSHRADIQNAVFCTQAELVQDADFLHDNSCDIELSTDVPVFFAQGDRGNDILTLQNSLHILGYDIGEANGIYTLSTASAVKAFQEDTGLRADGVCTAAIFAAVQYLALRQDTGNNLAKGTAGAEDLAYTADTDAVWSALADAGYDPASYEDSAQNQNGTASHSYALRCALILFQRTHGLSGTGTPDFATCCALGLNDGTWNMAAGESETENAFYDLHVTMLVSALSTFAQQYRQSAGGTMDLWTLTACAEVLLNRVSSPLFTVDDTLGAVCKNTALYGGASISSNFPAAGSTPMEHEALLRRAVEDALFAQKTGSTITNGALYIYPRAKEITLPENITVCAQTESLLFAK